MKQKIYSALILLIIFSIQSIAQKKVSVSSPDGKINFKLGIVNKSPVFEITYQKKAIINSSPLSLDFESGPWGQNLQMDKAIYKEVDEFYDLTVGKARHVHNYYRQV